MTVESLSDRMAKLGFSVRVVSAKRLEDLGRAIEDQHAQGLFDTGFFEERLAGFRFGVPDDLPDARSLIVVGYRDPNVRFTFEWKGKAVPALVPSTYIHWIERDARAKQALAGLVEAEGYTLVEAKVPKKLLAVRSGLAKYGRNNITYAEDLGSYYRLAVFISDLPCEDDTWVEPTLMDRCNDCSACVRACPTGAIDADRFLLRAERCITFWNEKPDGIPFPDWLEASWHNCVVGCLHCQRVCPENPSVSDACEEGVTFSEEETRLLLEGGHRDTLPAGLVQKLEESDLLPELDTLPRNLGVILESAISGGES
jgi:epoxyqueuosine reductase